MPDVTRRDPADLDQIVKAYDVRGVVPGPARRGPRARRRRRLRPPRPRRGRPARHRRRRPRHASEQPARWSRPSPRARPARGPTSSGSGWRPPTTSTSPSGYLDAPGAMFTASHNPAQYNGIKLCRAGAAPVGQDTGLARIRDARGRASRRRRVRRAPCPSATCWQEYADYLHEPRRPVRDPAACGSSSTRATAWPGSPRPACSPGCRSTVVAAVLRARRHLPQPRGEPDRAGEPARPAGSGGRETAADLGLAFDGDADRCFVVDERGEIGLAVHADRADRGARARARTRARRSSTT